MTVLDLAEVHALVSIEKRAATSSCLSRIVRECTVSGRCVRMGGLAPEGPPPLLDTKIVNMHFSSPLKVPPPLRNPPS